MCAMRNRARWNDLDNDTVRMVLENITDDIKLIRLMRLNKASSSLAKQVFQVRHGLEHEQAVAAIKVMLGNNAFITGGPGTGKSFTTSLLIRMAKRRFGSRGVAVCASTWLAAGNVGGESIDRTLGFRKMCPTHLPETVLMRHEVEHKRPPVEEEEEETQIVNDDEDEIDDGEMFAPVYSEIVARKLSMLRVIFIDEVSMVSDYKLSLVHAALRLYCGKQMPQFVLVADFCQLPPIICDGTLEDAAVKSGEFKDFCFLGDTWASLKLSTAELKVSRRCGNFEYNDKVLARMRMGVFDLLCKKTFQRLASKDTMTMWQAAKARRLGLFGTNEACKTFDRLTLKLHDQALLRTKSSVDIPTTWGRQCAKLPSSIQYKVGLRAIALTRIGEVGAKDCVLRGTLLDVLSEDDIDCVRVGDDGNEIPMRRVEVEKVYYKRGEESQASTRVQFPFKHCASLTVHKAQGRTVRVEQYIDFATTKWASHRKVNGMLYTLLSRTSDPALIAYVNLHAAQNFIDPRVLLFYRRASAAAAPFWTR